MEKRLKIQTNKLKLNADSISLLKHKQNHIPDRNRFIINKVITTASCSRTTISKRGYHGKPK